MALSAANKNLVARIGTAIAFVPLLILSIAWKEPHAWSAIVGAATLIGLKEFFTIVAADAPGLRGPGIALGAIFTAGLYFAPGALTPFVGGVALLAFLYLLARLGDMRTVVVRTALLTLGVVYVAGLLPQLALLKRDFASGSEWVFLTMTMVWFGDTTAYGFGRTLGRHKLYPAVSPGKTVEGALGGFVGNMGAVVLAKLWYMPELPWSALALLALPAGALGQIGDLCESMLKRAYGVKDSGTLLPGHGGMLDRVDALMFAAPWVYVYARYLL